MNINQAYKICRCFRR